jgi:hypothetical protein
MHNKSLDADTQHQAAASRRVLRAGQLQRYPAAVETAWKLTGGARRHLAPRGAAPSGKAYMADAMSKRVGATVRGRQISSQPSKSRSLKRLAPIDSNEQEGANCAGCLQLYRARTKRYCARADRGFFWGTNVMRMFVVLTGIAAAAMSGAAIAQTQVELRAAADRWLSQEVIKVQYSSSTGWSSTFEVNAKAGKTNFVGSIDRVCLGSAVPTKLDYVEPELIFAFQPAATGCNPPRYRFNPVTGKGKVFTTPDGGATWIESASRVSLVQ